MTLFEEPVLFRQGFLNFKEIDIVMQVKLHSCFPQPLSTDLFNHKLIDSLAATDLQVGITSELVKVGFNSVFMVIR